MKKKILAIVLCIAMLAIAIVGGTMAYFTDKDADTNVFVSGNVSIQQLEHTFDEDGNFVALTADSADSALKLLPVVFFGQGNYPTADSMFVFSNYYSTLDNEDETDEARDERWGMLWDEPNVVDKIVSVYNDGSNDVYVRTIVAVPAGLVNNIRTNAVIPGITWDYVTGTDTITVDGIEYIYTVYTYVRGDGILEAGKSTGPSLLQVLLTNDTDNDDLEGYADGFKVLVASQAVQADGFAEALEGQENIPQTALNEAFGEISATNNPWS